MNFCVVNLGCKVNKVESDSYETLFKNAGLVCTSFMQAQVVVVNTCAVTAEAEKKTRKTLRRIVKQNTFGHIVVTGCSAVLNREIYEQMSKRVTVVGKVDVITYLTDYLHKHYVSEQGVRNSQSALNTQKSDHSPDSSATSTQQENRFRRGVKVQDGCNNACSYCVVHIARGPATSRSVEEIIRDVCAYQAQGVKEIMLTGINLGSYEQHYHEQTLRLATLLELLLEQSRLYAQQLRRGVTSSLLYPLAATQKTYTPIYTSSAHGGTNFNDGTPFDNAVRFRIGSVEPLDVDNALIKVLARSHAHVCKHLHLPLQSGSTQVLQNMYRPYTAQDYLSLVTKLRREIPSISLSTDIIVGFPGETKADFNETCELAKACAFSKIHVFPYSKRKGTPASRMKEQIDPTEKMRRARILRNLAHELSCADLNNRVGTREWAVVESPGVATTDSYHKVHCDTNAKPGDMISYYFEP